ncbi:MAG: hypothetical protein ACYTFG_00145 [Planctomycetota bacterium]|jgi:hypothetical protein
MKVDLRTMSEDEIRILLIALRLVTEIDDEPPVMTDSQQELGWELFEKFNDFVDRREGRKQVACEPKGESEDGLYTVRVYDGMDHHWVDCLDASEVTLEEAQRYWNERTKGGTEKTAFADIDYYAIFPAETAMLHRSPVE